MKTINSKTDVQRVTVCILCVYCVGVFDEEKKYLHVGRSFLPRRQLQGPE